MVRDGYSVGNGYFSSLEEYGYWFSFMFSNEYVLFLYFVICIWFWIS